MHYVIVRDDDTNALTPPECLEQLYRPFLNRGMPVNLSTIPDVRTDVTLPNGELEGYLMARNGTSATTLPIGSSHTLVRYLRDNPGYHLIQHGCNHSVDEFDCHDPKLVFERLDWGAQCLREAGLKQPRTFVAPYDKFSRIALKAASARYRVISTGHFELKRVPHAWLPFYLFKKATQQTHWQVGKTLLLSHPGCLLSRYRDYTTMLDVVRHSVTSRRLTVLVTHWWEYFRNRQPDNAFISILHETADYLANHPGLKVISFNDLARGDIPLH